MERAYLEFFTIAMATSLFPVRTATSKHVSPWVLQTVKLALFSISKFTMPM